jgi:AsmA protein
MKLLLKIGAGVVALVVVALIAVNMLISASAVRDRVAARVKEQTGRDLAVNGSTSLLLLPNPHIVLTDAEITDPENRTGADLKIARLALDVTFAQLFSRQVDAKRVVMEHPVLTVRLAQQAGTPDRQGDAGPLPGAVPRKQAAAAFTNFIAADARGGSPRRDIMLDDVQIEDGTVRIIYDADGAERTVEHIHANLSLPHLVDPLTAKGDFDWKGVKVGFDLKLATPADLDTRTARLDLALTTEAIDANFGGNVAAKPAFSLEGDVTAKSQSVPSLLAWLRKEPASFTAVGSGEISSHVVWQPGEITLTQSRFALSHATGQGQAVLTLRSPRPHLRAALVLQTLDLDPFLAGSPSKRTEADPPAVRRQDTASAGAAIFVGSAQAEEGPAAAEAAPPEAVAPEETPVILPAAFEADVNANVLQTKVAGLTIGPSSLGLNLRDGVLDAKLTGMQLYDGQGTGALTLNAAKPVPSFTGNFVLDGVSAKPLLDAAAGFNLLSGHAKLELQLSGAGSTGEEIKHSLEGKGTLAISDGAIEGINLTELINGIGAGQMPDLNQGPGAKTTFSALGGSFTLASGVAETHDLEVTSPVLQVTARGTVDLVTGSLDFLTQPEIVAGPEGKGGANNLAGLTIPVRIEGPFAHPTFKPEIKGVFASPDQASKTVKEIGDVLQKKFKGKPMGEAIGRMLGSVRIGKNRNDATSDDTEDAPAAKPHQQGQKAAPPAAADQEPSEDSDEPKDPDLNNILR